MKTAELFRKKTYSNAISEESQVTDESKLKRVLSVRDLTFFGIAAIIGAGSFSSMGQACYNGGPGVVFLFLICSVACGFTALCYAEFASRVNGSGSAYTYAYVTFGELFAWIIGWALLMEYSIGNIYVAFSWSGYFTNLLHSIGIHFPEWLSINYKSALREVHEKVISGNGIMAWKNAPQIAGMRIIIDLPAILINSFITWLVYIGVKESRNLSNTIVILKLVILLLVIIVGVFYIDINNWTPFMPNGFNGVMAGVSAVFFAYIGFDAVSTLSEESKNPQRDLPRGMIYSLIICTVIYVILSLVLTGMVSYRELGVSDPLAQVFNLRGVKWMLLIVSIAALFAMTSVLLVFQMGQPRIWLSMSRDGLIPKQFSSIHPKYNTPGFATIITGLVVGIPIFFTDPEFVLDFTSIGTLFAFSLVCGGVLLLPGQSDKEIKSRNNFKLPYINGKIIVPILTILSFILFYVLNPLFLKNLFNFGNGSIFDKIPLIIFILICILLSIFTYLKNFSLIPVLGLLSCCYLLTGMAASNWIWFFTWLTIGLIIYFTYSFKKSKLNTVKIK